MVMALSDVPRMPDRQGVRTLGNLSINLDNYRVAVDGKVVDLTFHQMELLRLFFERADRVISYEEIADRMWHIADRPALRHLHVLVHRLRLKLAGSFPYQIETVRGRGYGLLRARSVETADDWKA